MTILIFLYFSYFLIFFILYEKTLIHPQSHFHTPAMEKGKGENEIQIFPVQLQWMRSKNLLKVVF